MDPFLYAYDAILYPSHYSHLQNRVETIRIHHNFLWFVMFFLAATTSHWRILFISSFELFMSLTGDFFKVYLIFLKIGCLNFVFFYGLKLNSKKKDGWTLYKWWWHKLKQFIRAFLRVTLIMSIMFSKNDSKTSNFKVFNSKFFYLKFHHSIIIFKFSYF